VCGSEALTVPDPLAVGVVEPVGQPLGLQQLVAVSAQKQRLPTPKKKQKSDLSSLSYVPSVADP
jgi:hypothetical protein